MIGTQEKGKSVVNFEDILCGKILLIRDISTRKIKRTKPVDDRTRSLNYVSLTFLIESKIILLLQSSPQVLQHHRIEYRLIHCKVYV